MARRYVSCKCVHACVRARARMPERACARCPARARGHARGHSPRGMRPPARPPAREPASPPARPTVCPSRALLPARHGMARLRTVASPPYARPRCARASRNDPSPIRGTLACVKRHSSKMLMCTNTLGRCGAKGNTPSCSRSHLSCRRCLPHPPQRSRGRTSDCRPAIQGTRSKEEGGC